MSIGIFSRRTVKRSRTWTNAMEWRLEAPHQSSREEWSEREFRMTYGPLRLSYRNSVSLTPFHALCPEAYLAPGLSLNELRFRHLNHTNHLSRSPSDATGARLGPRNYSSPIPSIKQPLPDMNPRG